MTTSKEQSTSNKESSLFKDAVTDVKPLEQKIPPPFRQKPLPQRLHPQHSESEGRDDLFSDEGDPVKSDEQLLFYRTGLQQATLKKLRRGQIPVEIDLDLHGRTVAEARVELTEFIHFSIKNGVRCVRIIHGRGKGSHDSQPILKQKVNHWLRQRDEVLAFCSATNRDGGTGAIYLLLRRKTR
ncbi:MAG: Smr/MutS family endonuclease [Chromatiales bacterium]|nr:Smr/MutS family endonuclease [Chromatiales bacterium]